MPLSLEQQAERHIRTLRAIRSIEVPRAEASALTKAARLTRTRVVRGVAKQLKLKQKTIRERTFTRRATARKLTATVRHYVRPVSAISQFTPAARARLRVGFGTNRSGVKVRGHPTFKSAFIARGNDNKVKNSRATGKKQVFRRKGRGRLPLEKIEFDIHDATVDVASRVAPRVMKNEFSRLLVADLRFRINKYGTR